MWFVYSVFAAISRSLTGIFKKIGLKSIDEYQLAFNIKSVAVPIVGAAVLLEGKPQDLTFEFWMSLVVAGTLTAITTVLILKAFKKSELSKVYPLMAFLPVFLLLSSFVLLDELPPLTGLAGVVLVSFGAYVINLERGDRFFEPVKRLAMDRGSQLMFLVVLIWSVTSNIDKIATRSVTPLFWTFSLFMYMSILLYTYNKLSGKKRLISFGSNKFGVVLAISVTTILALLFQVIAIQSSFVSYVHAVKRLDILITILLSWILFHEHNIGRRLEGGIIMLIGIYLIAA